MQTHSNTDDSNTAGSAETPSRQPDGQWMSPRQRAFMLILLAILAGVVLFFKLGDSRTLGSHEGYVMIPAREMLRSGDWIVPRFGGVPRLEKPPLSYWVVAASATLCGELNEWSGRLPAALSALALSILMGVWAGRWYGPAAGFAAVVVQLTSVYVLIFARKAEVDMLLCLLTTSALFLVANQQADESSRRTFMRWVGIYCLLSIAWLAKFHFGPAMVLAPTVLYFGIQRRLRSLRHLANPIGLIFVAASVLIWPYLVLNRIPEAWNVWQSETIGRAVGNLGHQPIWYYVPHLAMLSLPWLPFALAAVPASWQRAWKQRDARERFLWIWFLTQLAIVTVSANKHQHYLNAALPMLTLLAAQSWVVLIKRVRQRKQLIDVRWAVGLTAGCLIAVVVASSILVHKWPHLIAPALAVSATVGLGGCGVVWLLWRQQAVAAGCAALLVFLSAYVGATGWIVPQRDHRLAATRFASAVRREVSPDQKICVYRMGTTSLLYYLRHPVFRVESESELKTMLDRQGRLLLVTDQERASELPALGRILARKTMRYDASLPQPKHPPLVLVELTKSGPGGKYAFHADEIAIRKAGRRQ